ncbi:helix-turn-helix domain-containing protein [Jeotgalibaca porci]|uniref:helix-turn-helix domain-containing protein n=1 Tax=Jeotgalibaca porci TaxID=1868793 RepID=UPI003F918746
MEVDKKEVGSRIKKVRLDLGEKTEDFGKHFSPVANRSLVSAWENGRYLPNAERLKKIAELGSISVEELLYGSLDDLANRLLSELERDLVEKDELNKGVIELIINDINSRMFPKLFPRGAKDAESLKKEFEEYKKDAIDTWTDFEKLDYEIVSRIGYVLSSDIYDNLKYLYSDFYENDSAERNKGKKITDKADEYVKRLEQLERFQRSYIEGLRHLNRKEVIAELDKIEDYTNAIDNKTGVIKL